MEITCLVGSFADANLYNKLAFKCLRSPVRAFTMPRLGVIGTKVVELSKCFFKEVEFLPFEIGI